MKEPMTLTLQWIELENGCWESAEGRFYISQKFPSGTYTIWERSICYEPKGESVPKSTKVDKREFCTLEECQEWAHKELQKHWGFLYYF